MNNGSRNSRDYHGYEKFKLVSVGFDSAGHHSKFVYLISLVLPARYLVSKRLTFNCAFQLMCFTPSFSAKL